MGDPFQFNGGDISPFVKNFSTISGACDLLRKFRDRGDGDNTGGGGGDLNLSRLTPATRILIRNDTGAELAPGYIVKIGAGVTAYTGDDQYAFRQTPCHIGTTPDATTNNFAILEEPAAALQSGVYSYARAATLGVTVCDINITDAAHGYATPTASDATKLTSSTSGPVTILDKESSGTGTKRCVVEVTGQWASSSSPVYGEGVMASSFTNITPDSTYVSIDTQITLPSAGTYLLSNTVSTDILATAGPVGSGISARLYSVTNSVDIPSSGFFVYANQVEVLSVQSRMSVAWSHLYTATGSDNIRMEAVRAAGMTWSFCKANYGRIVYQKLA